ncbi:MAG: DegT/DnrJ/EryC1/StrS family aminotransferase [Ignavibacteria bacterium]|nr:DegT/DnrJ/EryC1/StrS family aminotransferase [Ignavibacteria bacterium]
MKIHMVDTKTQYLKIKDQVDAAIQEVIDSTQFIQGEVVRKFEEEISAYVGCKYAVGCASGTDALQICLMAIGLKPGDEVITTPFTFAATAETIALLGGVPVYADIDGKTYNIDTDKIEAKISNKTKAIIPVHLYGQPAEMDMILSLAEKYNLYVIEDSAQALGAKYKDKKVCNIGHLGAISFYPSKNLGAFGDGGMITTNDETLAERVRMICNHGSKTKYFHEILGVNSRLDSIQAAVLRVKLKYLDSYNNSRRLAADRYNKRLSQYLETPYVLPHVRHIFHQYSVKVDRRDEMKKYLSSFGIPTMIYYPVPLHLQKAYSFNYGKGDFPVSEKVSGEIISLPMHSELTDEQIDFISDKIIDFIRGN